MTDIDPKSIPVLDDVIEDDSNDDHSKDDHANDHHANDQHAPITDQASAVEDDDLFSPSSLLEKQASQPENDIDHAATIAALDGSMEGSTDADIHHVSDTTDHIDALDESTPAGGIDLYKEDILDASMDAPDVGPVADSVTAPDSGIVENSTVDTVQTGSSLQAEINTAAVTSQIIDRIMPEIEQRLRVIIDLTLRENLRDRNSEE